MLIIIVIHDQSLCVLRCHLLVFLIHLQLFGKFFGLDSPAAPTAVGFCSFLGMQLTINKQANNHMIEQLFKVTGKRKNKKVQWCQKEVCQTQIWRTSQQPAVNDRLEICCGHGLWHLASTGLNVLMRQNLLRPLNLTS